ncbi:NAD(P)-dependent oxidoreductase [Streptomyces sp. NPDC058424]|uniref:NAD(P)-dependent oxidoreductase n=1 Tax=Streptomyces sp. NPDC058424 TaxID=3346491 RepID=UPI003661990B
MPLTTDPATSVDVAVVEDVWGKPFEDLAQRHTVVHEPTAWADPERLVALARGARALVVRNRTQVTGELLAQCPQLRVVARAGVGLDNIDLAAAEQAGVTVVSPRGANSQSVAELALAMALALARRVAVLDADCRQGGWDRTPGRELAGGVWGLLGAGATSLATARLARALDMTVVAYDPYRPATDPELAAAGVQLAPLQTVVTQADVLSCHLPGTPETHRLVNAELLAQVRSGAFFVNVGRGDVVDEDALADALESGRLAGAGLDVRTDEPPKAGRLERLPNVVLTPHIAGLTAASQERIMRALADDVGAVLAGEPARNAVGPVSGEAVA